IAIERHHELLVEEIDTVILVTGQRRAPHRHGRIAADTEKPRPGKTGASVACRCAGPTEPIRIVGGHNDAASKMPQFYRHCNSYSAKLTTNCVRLTAPVSAAAITRPPGGK